MEKQQFIDEPGTQHNNRDEQKVWEILEDLLNNYNKHQIKGIQHSEMELNAGNPKSD